jgi:hypothetical protein
MNPVHKHTPAPGSAHLSHLIDMGAALAAACTDLCREPTPERADMLLAKLKGAEAGVRQFRRQLVADQEARRDPD